VEAVVAVENLAGGNIEEVFIEAAGDFHHDGRIEVAGVIGKQQKALVLEGAKAVEIGIGDGDLDAAAKAVE
jgi:hypothetical protein